MIIDTLFKRYYINGKPIYLTDFGRAVFKTLEKYAPQILDEQLTRDIEEDMEKIVKLEVKPKQVINKGKKILEEVLKDFKDNEEKIGKELLTFMEGRKNDSPKKS